MCFGVTVAGGVPVFATTRLKDGSDIIDIMNLVKAKVLVIDAEIDDDSWKILKKIKPSRQTKSYLVPTLTMIIRHGQKNKFDDATINVDELIFENVNQDVALPKVLPEDVMAYFLTSGTTGQPKIVTHTLTFPY